MGRPKTKHSTLAEQLAAEKAKIQAAKEKIDLLQKKEGERLASLASRAGLLEVDLSDKEILEAFEALVSKKSGSLPVSQT